MNIYNHTTNSQQAQQRATNSRNDGIVAAKVRHPLSTLTNLNSKNLPQALVNGIPRFKRHSLNHSTELKNSLTDGNYQGYYEDLSKTISGLPYRHTLAFFVPKVSLASQAIKRLSTKQFIQYSTLQDKTIISIVSKLLAPYDGLTLQNKRAFGRICRAVTNSTESKTHHPMNFHNVITTQKLLGGL